MQKKLVVFYSLMGNTKYIAEVIAETINADILELKPVKELKADGGMTYFWGGYQSTMKKKPKLEEININPLEYDLIFIGTPVWAWRFSPPIRSFLSKYDFSGKDVVLWMCCAGSGVKAMKRFKSALKEAKILGDVCFQEPLKLGPEEAKENAIAWAKDITGNNKL